MDDTRLKVLECLPSVCGIDGATNVQNQSKSNVIVFNPVPFFIEYIQSDCKRETADELLIKIQGFLVRMDTWLASV